MVCKIKRDRKRLQKYRQNLRHVENCDNYMYRILRYSFTFWLFISFSGIQTSQDAKFYGISHKFDKPFSNEGKTLVIQFTVKHEQNIDCGGGYMKLYPSDLDQKNLHGDSPYLVMFGKLEWSPMLYMFVSKEQKKDILLYLLVFTRTIFITNTLSIDFNVESKFTLHDYNMWFHIK